MPEQRGDKVNNNSGKDWKRL